MHALLHTEANETSFRSFFQPVFLVPRHGTTTPLDFKVVNFSEELIKEISKTQLTILNILPPYAVRYKLINLISNYGFTLISQSSYSIVKSMESRTEETFSYHEYVFTLPKSFHHETFPDIITKFSP